MNVYVSSSEKPLDKSEQRDLALDLLDYALQKEFGVKRSEMILGMGEHGKPYFVDSAICFNYSHCEFGAACVVAKEEVGVDIESVTRFIRPQVRHRVCCARELEAIKSDEDFIKIWVQKEAFAKFTGKGFAEGFRKIDTTAFPEGLVLKHGNLYIAYYYSTAKVLAPVNCQLSIVNCL